jgi:DNA primase large subunit
LFRQRFETDDAREKQAFIASLGLDWEAVEDEEKDSLTNQLLAATGAKKLEKEGYFKVDWERVTDLVEKRQVLLKAGKAYVPASLQVSLVVAEFTARLDKALEVALPCTTCLIRISNNLYRTPPVPSLASTKTIV